MNSGTRGVSCLFCLVLSLFTPGVVASQQRQSREQEDERRLQLKIPERAARFGSHRIDWVTERPSLPDLDTLVAKSEIIVHCVVDGVASRLTKNQAGIWTDFNVDVREVIKAPALEVVPRRLVATAGGGTLVFPEGTVEVVADGWEAFPRLGEEYFLFLQYDTYHERYIPVGGPQGAYRVVGEKILPCSKPEFKLYSENLGKMVAEFRTQIGK